MTPGMGKKTALVTGGSGGIGYELAKLLALDAYHLVLVARHEPTLRQVAQELQRDFRSSVMIIAKDLARPSAPEEIARELEQASIAVDALVNNAGFATYGPFAQSDLASQLGKQLAFFLVSGTFLPFDLRPFAMPAHI